MGILEEITIDFDIFALQKASCVSLSAPCLERTFERLMSWNHSRQALGWPVSPHWVAIPVSNRPFTLTIGGIPRWALTHRDILP